MELAAGHARVGDVPLLALKDDARPRAMDAVGAAVDVGLLVVDGRVGVRVVGGRKVKHPLDLPSLAATDVLGEVTRELHAVEKGEDVGLVPRLHDDDGRGGGGGSGGGFVLSARGGRLDAEAVGEHLGKVTNLVGSEFNLAVGVEADTGGR